MKLVHGLKRSIRGFFLGSKKKDKWVENQIREMAKLGARLVL